MCDGVWVCCIGVRGPGRGEGGLEGNLGGWTLGGGAVIEQDKLEQGSHAGRECHISGTASIKTNIESEPSANNNRHQLDQSCTRLKNRRSCGRSSSWAEGGIT
jgi:hypothetical protein